MSHALGYARAGLDVLPLTPSGKTPLGALVPHGKDDATHDVEQVRDWWVQCPTANIGIRPAVGVLVVDVDPRAGGATALAELSRAHGCLSPTWTAYTGGGGLHAWYRVTGPLRAKLCTGVDLKHHAGYVVAPPSLHASGRRYTWGNALPVADAPDWLLPMLRRPAPVLRSLTQACSPVAMMTAWSAWSPLLVVTDTTACSGLCAALWNATGSRPICGRVWWSLLNRWATKKRNAPSTARSLGRWPHEYPGLLERRTTDTGRAG